jgi:hypothetical protein
MAMAAWRGGESAAGKGQRLQNHEITIDFID